MPYQPYDKHAALKALLGPVPIRGARSKAVAKHQDPIEDADDLSEGLQEPLVESIVEPLPQATEPLVPGIVETQPYGYDIVPEPTEPLIPGVPETPQPSPSQDLIGDIERAVVALIDIVEEYVEHIDQAKTLLPSATEILTRTISGYPLVVRTILQNIFDVVLDLNGGVKVFEKHATDLRECLDEFQTSEDVKPLIRLHETIKKRHMYSIVDLHWAEVMRAIDAYTESVRLFDKEFLMDLEHEPTA